MVKRIKRAEKGIESLKEQIEKHFDKIVLPEDEEEKAKFIKLLKDLEVYEECSIVCYPKLNSKILKDEMDKKIKNAVDIVKDFRLSLSKRKDVEDEE